MCILEIKIELLVVDDEEETRLVSVNLDHVPVRFLEFFRGR